MNGGLCAVCVKYQCGFDQRAETLLERAIVRLCVLVVGWLVAVSLLHSTRFQWAISMGAFDPSSKYIQTTCFLLLLSHHWQCIFSGKSGKFIFLIDFPEKREIFFWNLLEIFYDDLFIFGGGGDISFKASCSSQWAATAREIYGWAIEQQLPYPISIFQTLFLSLSLLFDKNRHQECVCVCENLFMQ